MERVGLCLVVFFLAMAESEAVRCWTCSTLSESGCGDDPFNNTTLNMMNCPSDTCMKTKGNDIVSRSCGTLSGSGKDECIEEGDVEICTCTGKLCNGATVKIVSMATLGFVFFTNLAIRFM